MAGHLPSFFIPIPGHLDDLRVPGWGWTLLELTDASHLVTMLGRIFYLYYTVKQDARNFWSNLEILLWRVQVYIWKIIHWGSSILLQTPKQSVSVLDFQTRILGYRAFYVINPWPYNFSKSTQNNSKEIMTLTLFGYLILISRDFYNVFLCLHLTFSFNWEDNYIKHSS